MFLMLGSDYNVHKCYDNAKNVKVWCLWRQWQASWAGNKIFSCFLAKILYRPYKKKQKNNLSSPFTQFWPKSCIWYEAIPTINSVIKASYKIISHREFCRSTTFRWATVTSPSRLMPTSQWHCQCSSFRLMSRSSLPQFFWSCWTAHNKITYFPPGVCSWWNGWLYGCAIWSQVIVLCWK